MEPTTSEHRMYVARRPERDGRSPRSVSRPALGRAVLVGLLVSTVAGCGGAAPGKTYYQRNIEPILLQKCAGNTSGCHSTNTDDPYSFAAGNFDVTSFENVQ